MLNRIVIATVAFIAVGCGGNHSTAPSNSSTPANVAGAWSGTFQFTGGGGGRSTAPLSMALTQNGNSVGGTWTATADLVTSGRVTGGISTNTFTGTFTFTASLTTTCTGTFPVSGSIGADSISWTSPGVTGTCSGLPTSITISARR